jgi:hypothetical protein
MLKASAFILLIPILILCLLLAINKRTVIIKMATEYIQCQIQQGELAKDTQESNKKCVIRYPDGGTPCVDSNQCKGFCVFENIRSMGTNGICQDNSLSDGCWKEGIMDKTCCRQDGDVQCWNN